MDLEEKNEIKIKILTAIVEIEQDIDSLEELSRPVAPDNAIGRISRMDAINSRSINQASLSAARRRLTLLHRALGRIDDPAFGICEDCGEPIPVGRILIMPETCFCVHCAS